MNRIFSGLALVAFVALGMYWAQRPRYKDMLAPRLIEAEAADTVPFSAQCIRPVRGLLKFRARAVTPEPLATHHGLREKPSAMAESQIKYLRGFFHFSEIEGLRINVLVDTKIRVLSSGPAPYPDSFEVDSLPDDPAKYPKSFFPRQVRKGEPAYTVEYEAEVPFISCTRRSDPLVEMELRLPADPYLAFWYVQKNERRNVSWFGVAHVTNPCAYEQMADLKQPSMYWYVWNPIKKTAALDCNALLSSREIVTARVSIDTEVPSARELSVVSYLGDEPLRVAIIFGYLGSQDVEKTSRDLASNSRGFATGTRYGVTDPGVQIASGVSNFLARIAELGPWKMTREGESFVFSSEGRLKESGRTIEIQSFVGPTVDYQPGTKHWYFLARALTSANFVFYNGHAGMGSSFTLEGLKKASGIELDPMQLPKYQFVAGLSCFATDYFGHDLASFRQRSRLTTDMMLAGFEGHSFMMIPAVLQYVDLSLAGKTVSLKKSMERFLSIDQPVHVTHYRGD